MPDTTHLTPSGEVQIPARVRETLNLKTGDKFDVLVREGEIILRRSNALPGADQLAEFLAKSKSAGSKTIALEDKKAKPK